MAVTHETKSTLLERTAARISLIAATLTFIAIYVATVHGAGWAIGLSLGWIPAGLAAYVAFVAGVYLFPLLAWLLATEAIGLASFTIWH